MFDLDKWQEILATMQKNKLRTFLTALSVFWGIFMLIFMQGAGKGLENGVMQGFGNHATNACYVWGQKTTMPYDGMKAGRWIGFTSDDMIAIEQEVKGIKYLAPQLRRNGMIMTFNNKSASFELKGDVPEYQHINPMSIPEGRFINEKDIDKKRKVCVLGKRAKEVLFDGVQESALGKYINISGIYFQVVGIAKSFREGDDAQEDEETVYIPASTMQGTFVKGNRVNYFSFLAEDNVKVSQAEDQVKAVLQKRHKIDPEDKTAIGSANLEREFGQMQGLFAGISGLMWFVGICTIAAGVIGVSNIMLIVVKERTKEIGLRKALGATPFSIISLIVQESIFITTMSGYFGLLLGVAVIEGLRQLLIMANMKGEMFANPQVDISVAIGATIFLIIAGAFAGLMPASKAAAISPVEALRDE